uniref:Uncharacterized protein n=1 Tax=Arundo donax TaxID=35708 RepID=A0A0A9C485_ARUDO
MPNMLFVKVWNSRLKKKISIHIATRRMFKIQEDYIHLRFQSASIVIAQQTM